MRRTMHEVLGSNPTRHRDEEYIFLVLEDLKSGFKTIGTKESCPLVPYSKPLAKWD